MPFVRSAALAAALALAPLTATAAVLAQLNGIEVEDGYAAAFGPGAPTAAAYMRITNQAATDDRLLDVRTDAAARATLHVSETSDGVTRMRHLADGIALPAGGSVLLARGGLHVMLMGLKAPLAEGGSIGMTLVFERAGEIPLRLPVEPAGGPAEGASGGAMGDMPGMKP